MGVVVVLGLTHFLAGAAAGLLAGGDPVQSLVSGAAALLPDVDHPGSRAGRAAPGVSHLLNFAFGHRGFFHSLVAAGCAAWLLPRLAAPVGLAVSWEAVLMGYLAHLALDTLTPGGVAWLWPLNVRFSLPVVKTGSVLERLVIAPVVLLFVVSRVI